jgi:hypothetical protein
MQLTHSACLFNVLFGVRTRAISPKITSFAFKWVNLYRYAKPLNLDFKACMFITMNWQAAKKVSPSELVNKMLTDTRDKAGRGGVQIELSNRGKKFRLAWRRYCRSHSLQGAWFQPLRLYV